MIKFLAVFAISLSLTIVACKMVHIRTFKLTNSPEIKGNEILLKTINGTYVYLSAAQLSEQETENLKSLRPYQCVEIKTPESIDINHREVHFKDFKFRKLVESAAECRKIKITNTISIH